jgi:hypothetical protein
LWPDFPASDFGLSESAYGGQDWVCFGFVFLAAKTSYFL